MATIFQRKYERKHIVDDTQPLVAHIESSHTVNGHTEYVLRVRRGLPNTTTSTSATTAAAAAADNNNNNTWLVHRRYNEFAALHQHLSVSGISLPLPGKKLFGNLQPSFVAQRLSDLQMYLNAVLMNPILASSLTTRRFVDPEQYNQSFAELAIQNASLCLRNDGHYALGASLGAIGWRLRKHYFRVAAKTGAGARSGGDYVKTGGKHVLVKSGSQSHSAASGASSSSAAANGSGGGGGGSGGKSTSTSTSSSSGSSASGGGSGACGGDQPATELCLTWTEYGADKYLDDREMLSVLKSLAAAHHPYVARIEYATANDGGALVVRRFSARGSVKDMLCGSAPRHLFLQKYGNPNGRQALPLRDVALWSRQILEALRWLHERGMPNGHVHAGNVLVVDGRAQLLDVENFVLGVPAFYRPFFMQHSKICTAECIDVYSFGHLVFEMAMGYALQESVARQPTEGGVAASLKSLLDAILSKEACRIGLPTLDQLAGHPFFAEYAPQFQQQFAADVAATKPTLKLSTVAKEQLRMATQRTEQRLQNEQKSTKNQKRLVKIQEMMSSEEEKKKTTKHKQKLEQKQSKLRQQNSLQLSGGPPAPMVPFSRSDSVHGGLLSPPPKPLPSTSSFPTSSTVQLRQTSPQQPTPPALLSPAASLPSTSSASAQAAGHSQQATSPPAAAPPRSALLSSINSFNKSNLRRTEKARTQTPI